MQNLGRLLFGIALVAVGVLFLLDLGDYVNASRIIGQWWPVAVIAFGLFTMLGPSRSIIGGSIAIILGLILLLATLDFIGASAGDLIFPLVLIAVGVGILFVRSGARASSDPHNSIRGFTIFGAQEIASRGTSFTGGSAAALFGAASLDLREATIDPQGASLDTFVAFGAIDVVVPRGWRVTVTGIPIFGAFEDSLDRSVEPAPDAPQLRVGGLVLFGGVEVTHESD